MARLRIVGFETGDTIECAVTVGTSSVQSSTKRTGTYAFRVNPTAAGGLAVINGLAANGTMASLGLTTGYFRVYINAATLPGATTSLVQITDAGGNAIVQLKCTSGGVLTLVGSTTSATIATISTGTWYCVEIMAVKNSTCAARVDGGTAQTCTGGNFTIDQYRLGNTGDTVTTMDIFYDDVAIDDAAYPGVGEVHILKPNATGTTSNWTNGAGTSPTNVAEVPHDSDTSYITSSTSGDVTTVNLDSSATGGVTGPIAAMTTIGVVRDTVGVSSISLRTKSSATNSDTTALDPGSAYVPLQKIFTTDPNTSAAWTTGGLDALEIGVVNGANVGLRCTALYAMVECSGSIAYVQALAGSVGTISGSISKSLARSLAGASGTVSGTVVRKTLKPLSGAPASLGGTVAKQTNKPLAGTMGAVSGALTSLRIYPKSLAGAVGTVSGSLTRGIGKSLAGSTGTLSGAAVRAITRTLNGATGTLSGTVSRRWFLSLVGSVGNVAGSLGRRTNKLVNGSTGQLTGVLSRSIRKSLSGTTGTLSGAISRLRLITLTGAVGPITGGLTPVANLLARFLKRILRWGQPTTRVRILNSTTSIRNSQQDTDVRVND